MGERSHNLRMPDSFHDRAEQLVEAFRDTEAAASAGKRWGRTAVLRMAIARGLASMEQEVADMQERLNGDA